MKTQIGNSIERRTLSLQRSRMPDQTVYKSKNMRDSKKLIIPTCRGRFEESYIMLKKSKYYMATMDGYMLSMFQITVNNLKNIHLKLFSLNKINVYPWETLCLKFQIKMHF